jgi:hypothetical protein
LVRSARPFVVVARNLLDQLCRNDDQLALRVVRQSQNKEFLAHAQLLSKLHQQIDVKALAAQLVFRKLFLL